MRFSFFLPRYWHAAMLGSGIMAVRWLTAGCIYTCRAGQLLPSTCKIICPKWLVSYGKDEVPRAWPLEALDSVAENGSKSDGVSAL